jgi:hypothetical protein
VFRKSFKFRNIATVVSIRILLARKKSENANSSIKTPSSRRSEVKWKTCFHCNRDHKVRKAIPICCSLSASFTELLPRTALEALNRLKPPKLVIAHVALDRPVDHCYRSQPFTNKRQRVEFLFAMYEKLTIPLIASTKKKKRKS